MHRPRSASVAAVGLTSVKLAVEKELGWVFRNQPEEDFGIDAQVEIVECGTVTGRLLGLQIKSGLSWFTKPGPGGWWYWPKAHHVSYWANHSLSVAVVMYHPGTGLCYWQLVNPDTLVGTVTDGYKLLLPEAQLLDDGAREPLLSAAIPGKVAQSGQRPGDAYGGPPSIPSVSAPGLRRTADRRFSLVGLIPPRASAFQERVEGSVIENVLSPSDSGDLGTVESPVLSGLGGVGKSQLAVDYACRAVQNEELDLLLWISASSRPAIVSAYAEAAACVGASQSTGSAGQAAARFLAWLATTTSRWLVVLDDLRAPGLLTGISPPPSPSGKTIITTRRHDAALLRDGRKTVEIGPFARAEAVTFLCERLSAFPPLADDADGVASDLGCLPLALSHAAAFMIDRRMSCAEYRRLFADRESRITDLFPEPDALPDEYDRTIAVTWSISVDAADDLTPAGMARPLLELSSVLDANGIPAEVFTTSAALNWLSYSRSCRRGPDGGPWKETDSGMVRRGLHSLRRLSLLSADSDVVRVHRLVQRATREQLDDEDAREMMWAAADSLLSIWPDEDHDRETTRRLRANADVLSWHYPGALWQPHPHPLIFRHGDSLADSASVSDAIALYEQVLAQAIRYAGPAGRPAFKARLELARLRGKAGDPATAVRQLRQLAADQARVLGPDHPDVLMTRANLGVWLVTSGNTPDGIEEMERLHHDAASTLGPDNPTVMLVQGQLLAARARAGESADSIDHLQQLLARQETALGPDHPDTLTARLNLAELRGAEGDHAAAISDLEQLLADHIRVLGPEHPHTLDVRQSIAILRCASGDEDRGTQELEQLIAERARAFGPGYLTNSLARKEIARAYSAMGDNARAISTGETLLGELRQARAPDDPEILDIRRFLAITRGNDGDPGRALAELEEICADQSQIAGPSHPATLAARRDAAAMRCKTGEYAAGADLLEQLLGDQIRELGLGHPEILATRHELAAACARLGRHDRALAAHEALAENLRRTYRPCHHDALQARQVFAQWLSRCGHYTQAVGELEQLLADQVQTRGPEHPETLLTRQELASCLAGIGEAERSRAELERLLTDQTRLLGPGHSETLMTRSKLADRLDEAGDHAGAAAAYEVLLPEFERATGSDSKDTLIITAKLAMIRGKAGEVTDAVTVLEAILVKFRQVLSPDHYWTLLTRGNLAVFHAYTGNRTHALHELEIVLDHQARVLGPGHPGTIVTRGNLASLKSLEEPKPE